MGYFKYSVRLFGPLIELNAKHLGQLEIVFQFKVDPELLIVR